MKSSTAKLALVAVFVLALAAVLLAAEHPKDDGETYLPCMHIDAFGTDVTSKDDYISCKITVESYYHSLSDVDAGVKGRGNSTWEQPKKPYTIKFDKKMDLFGNGYAKTWVLIANYLDKSMARNYLAYTVADALEVDYTTSAQFVDLYLNGEYMGVYLVTEKVQIGEDRVDIADPEDPLEGEDQFSFKVEMDSHASAEGEEGVDYFTVNGRDYTVKDPSCTLEQVEMIRLFMVEVWDAIGSGDWGRVQEVLDAESFASTYVVEELFHDVDVDLTSFYLHRGADERLYSGPIWDFDLCAGNYNTLSSNDPGRLYAAWKSVWYSSLFEYEEFRDMVSELLSEKEGLIRQALDHGANYISQHDSDFMRNYEKWDTLDKHVDMNPFMLLALDTWQEHFDYTMSWLFRSLDTLVREYCRRQSLLSVTFENLVLDYKVFPIFGMIS